MALLETAVTAPIVLFVFLGIFEYGLLFRDYIVVSDATLNAARVGAVMGKNTVTPAIGAVQSGDYAIVAGLRNDLGGIPTNSIKRIVVFKGNALGQGTALSQVPGSCKTASTSVVNSCNVYDPTTAFLQIQADNGPYFICAGTPAVPAASPPPCGWPPSLRQDGQGTSTLNPTIDYLGVYVKLERPFVSKVFGSTFSYEAAGVQRLEPGFLES